MPVMYHIPTLWDEINRVTVHFHLVLMRHCALFPANNRSRRSAFSIEYIVYQVLAYGAVQDELFKLEAIDQIVRDYMNRIERV